MNLIWTTRARMDLGRLHDFLAGVAPSAAKRAIRAIGAAAGHLPSHPRMGEKIDGHGDREVRRLIVGDYELQYELTDDTIYVVRIWHGREQR